MYKELLPTGNIKTIVAKIESSELKGIIMENKENKWNALYAQYIQAGYSSWDEYFSEKMKLKKRFLNLVLKYSTNGKPVIECGAGTGKFSAYLASLGLEAYAIDFEDAMVEQTKQLSNSVSPENPVKAIQGDISNIPFSDKQFSVAHSSGVLEHFDDGKIVQLINEQLRVADTIVFSIPSLYFDNKMLGDERFLPRIEWRRIISTSNAKIVEESGYHYKPLKKRLLDIAKSPSKVFKPIALMTFVLQEKS
jgi:ubiquinone/menaquinone biosynthesis C-methylase UbiE